MSDTAGIVPEAPVLGDQDNTDEGDVNVTVTPIVNVAPEPEPEPEPVVAADGVEAVFAAGAEYGEVLATLAAHDSRIAALELAAEPVEEVEEVEGEIDEDTEPEDTDEDEPDRTEPKSTRVHWLNRSLKEWRNA